jgi:hypothetical protein
LPAACRTLPAAVVSASPTIADRTLRFTGHIVGRSRNPILVHDLRLAGSTRTPKLTKNFDVSS